MLRVGAEDSCDEAVSSDYIELLYWFFLSCNALQMQSGR